MIKDNRKVRVIHWNTKKSPACAALSAMFGENSHNTLRTLTNPDVSELICINGCKSKWDLPLMLEDNKTSCSECGGDLKYGTTREKYCPDCCTIEKIEPQEIIDHNKKVDEECQNHEN